MTHVSINTPTDRQLLQAVDLGVAMWAESDKYDHIKANVNKMIEFAYWCREDDDTFFEVAVSDDTCQGFLICSVAPLGFHSGSFVYDRLRYVDPTRRGSVYATKLIKSMEKWAKEKKAVHVLLGTTTGVYADRTEKFYNKLGYRTVGTLTMKEIE